MRTKRTPEEQASKVDLDDVVARGLHLVRVRGKASPAAVRKAVALAEPGQQVVVSRQAKPGEPWRVELDAALFFAAWKELHELRHAVHLIAQGQGVRA